MPARQGGRARESRRSFDLGGIRRCFSGLGAPAYEAARSEVPVEGRRGERRDNQREADPDRYDGAGGRHYSAVRRGDDHGRKHQGDRGLQPTPRPASNGSRSTSLGRCSVQALRRRTRSHGKRGNGAGVNVLTAVATDRVGNSQASVSRHGTTVSRRLHRPWKPGTGQAAAASIPGSSPASRRTIYA